MLGSGKKTAHPERRAFREEVEATTAKLRAAPETSQVAVGHAINMAHSLFAKSFGSPQEFLKLSVQDRHSYIKKLTTMEVKLREEQKDLAGSLGFGLFKMWVGTLSANDAELTETFSQQLAYFSKKGSPG